MQTIATKLSPVKARTELPRFAIAGVTLSLVSLLIFWFLGIVGLAFSARALLLANHKTNQGNPKLVQYRAMAVVGVLAGLVSVAYGFSN